MNSTQNNANAGEGTAASTAQVASGSAEVTMAHRVGRVRLMDAVAVAHCRVGCVVRYLVRADEWAGGETVLAARRGDTVFMCVEWTDGSRSWVTDWSLNYVSRVQKPAYVGAASFTLKPEDEVGIDWDA